MQAICLHDYLHSADVAFEICKRDSKDCSFDEVTDGHWQCMHPLGLWATVIGKSEDGTPQSPSGLFTWGNTRLDTCAAFG